MERQEQLANEFMEVYRKVEADYESLTLANDFIFGKVMQDETNCIGMLERLTGNKIESVKTVINQKAIQVTNDSKGVRYDVYVEDNNNIIYDAEIQQTKGIENLLSKRARYYQGMIDLSILEPGGLYSNLKTSYVIFICTFDPFGKGLSCYSFENICVGKEDLLLNDGRKIMFFNTKATNVNVSGEVVSFLRYLDSNQVCDDYTRQLDDEVSKARMNRDWRVEYMKTLLHDVDIKYAGIEEGRAEGLEKGRAEGLEKGRAEGLADFLIELLEEYGIVAEEIKQKIYSENDIEMLKKWIKFASSVTSINEFVEKMYL